MLNTRVEEKYEDSFKMKCPCYTFFLQIAFLDFFQKVFNQTKI